MRKIHHLPPDVITKIAAGEVIERPAYAVKELIENAIDAGADYITVQIENAGLKKIVITDNGEGMSKEDVEESWKPHTTSKIKSEEDLATVKSLGFRGEALSSIASVSTLTIKTRRKDSPAGQILTIKNGKLLSSSPIGAAPGTTVIIENLFSSVPARKKFLKSEKTELRHSIEIVSQFALMFPDIRFFLSHNGKPILDLPKVQEQRSRVNTILGSHISEHLIHIETEDSYLTLHGFIARPQITTKLPEKSFLFINSRRVSDKLIHNAVKEAYGTLIEKQSSPLYVLYFSLPHEVVDINVHPRKEQVKFFDSKLLYSLVVKNIQETLNENNISFQNLSWKKDALNSLKKNGTTKSFAGKVLKENTVPWDIRKKAPLTHDVSRIHSLYLTTEESSGLVLIDQHAAHERILYEQYKKEFTARTKRNKNVTLPKVQTVELSLSESHLLLEDLSFFKELGFDIEPFQDTTFKITAVPVLLKDRNIHETLKEILEALQEEKNPTLLDTFNHRMLAYLACRTSIKAGEKLTKKQAMDLVKKLKETENNTTCPHGRPTHIEVSIEELNRMFKRR